VVLKPQDAAVYLNGSNDLKTGVRIFRMIKRSRRPSHSRNADITANVGEMVTWERRWALRIMSDQLNINKEESA
jgi:hypothetical protein